jgi:hypothetical protein
MRNDFRDGGDADHRKATSSRARRIRCVPCHSCRNAFRHVCERRTTLRITEDPRLSECARRQLNSSRTRHRGDHFGNRRSFARSATSASYAAS